MQEDRSNSLSEYQLCYEGRGKGYKTFYFDNMRSKAREQCKRKFSDRELEAQ